MIESYKRDVTADDGALLTSCYRITRDGKQCEIHDMRYVSGYAGPRYYRKGHFQKLTQERFGEIKSGGIEASLCCKVGRVWIGDKGEWNVEISPHHNQGWGSLITNRCLEFIRTGK